MATRYRIRKTEAPDISPTKKGSWSNSAFIWRKLETGVYDSSGLGLTTSEVAETSSSAIYNILMSAVTGPLGAQTLSGTVSMQFQFKETDAAANMFARVGIYLIDSTGALKSTLLAQTTDAVEFVTTYTNRTVLASASLSSQSCANGDRILVEIGYYANNTKTTSYTGGVTYGSDSSLSDLPVNDTTTGNYLGWIEFSQDHATYNAPPTIELNTADQFNFGSDTTPTLEFTGSDNEDDAISYHLQISASGKLEGSFDDLTATGASLAYTLDGTSMYISPDGTHLYISYFVNPNIYVYQYNLSTAWDLSTASYHASKLIGHGHYGMHFSDDGYTMFLTDNYNIEKWTLSTAWDVSTASYITEYAITGDAYYLRFADNGKVLFVSGSDSIFDRYVLSTAWDVSSRTMDTEQYTNFEGPTLLFSPSGRTAIVGGYNSPELKLYELPYPFSAREKHKVDEHSLGWTTSFRQSFVSASGDKLYLSRSVGVGDRYVYEYTVDAFSDIDVVAISAEDDGFANTVIYSPPDTDPFTAGDKISYTVQAALSEALYYWRARCKDPNGNNAWSAWPTARSFLLSASVSISVPVAAMTLTAQVSAIQVQGETKVDVPAAALTVTAHAPTFTEWQTGLSRIRQEINLINTVLSAASGSAATSGAIALLDQSAYSDATFYFEIVGYTSASLAVDIKLRRKGTSTDDATCSIPAGTTTPMRIRSAAFTPPSAATEYVAYIPDTSGATKNIVSARIIVLQAGTTIIKSETQVEIGNHETGKSSGSKVALDYPKYWKYAEADYNLIEAVSAEVVYAVSSGGSGTVTITLQRDDGSFSGWTDVAAIVTAGSATTPTRVRVAATPVDGKHHRIVCQGNSLSGRTFDIYAAKIIVQQRSGYGWEEAVPVTPKQFHVRGGISGDGKYMYAAKWGDARLRRSADYGKTWGEARPVGDVDAKYSDYPFCVSETGQYVAVIVYYSYLETRIHLSKDYGVTWAEIRPLGSGTYNWSKAFMSYDGQTIIACISGGRVYISTDCGDSWSETQPFGNTNAYHDLYAMSYSGQYILATAGFGGGYDYVAVSSNYGTSWSLKGYYEYYVRPFVVMVGRSGRYMYIGGTTPVGKTFWSTDYGAYFSVTWPKGEGTYGTFAGDSAGVTGEVCLVDINTGVWYESTDNGATWSAMTLPSALQDYKWKHVYWSDEYEFCLALSDKNLDNEVGSEKMMVRTYAEGVVENIVLEWLIENTYNNEAGLSRHDTLFEPLEWDQATLALRHAIDSSTDTADSAKLQENPSGTPVDVSGSTATGANRAYSSVISTPSVAKELDTAILDAPLYASRIIAQVELVPFRAIEVPLASVVMATHVPVIYPLKVAIPTAALALIALPPSHYVPPDYTIEVPVASIQLGTRTPTHTWMVGADIAPQTKTAYRVVLTGGHVGKEDIEVPASYFVAITSYAEMSSVVLAIPDADGYEVPVTERMGGDIIISMVYIVPGVMEKAEELFRMPSMLMTVQRGGRSNVIVLYGVSEPQSGAPVRRTALKVRRVMKQANGKRVIEADVDMFCRCGDVYIYGAAENENIIIGSIEYYANASPVESKMTVKEW